MDQLTFPDFISSAVRFRGFVSQSSLGIGWLRRLSPVRRVGFGEIVFNFSMPLDKLKILLRLRASEVPTRLCKLVLRKGCRSLARRTTRTSRQP